MKKLSNKEVNIQTIKQEYNKIFEQKIYQEKDIYYDILARLCIGKTLDVGCGNNAKIASKISDSIGVDISEVAATQLKQKGHRTIVCNASYIPFKKETFNTVISLGALEHFANPNLVLKEMHRVLIRGGQLILTVDAKKNIFYTMVNKIKHFNKKYKTKDCLESQPIEKFFSKSYIIRMLYATGFRIVFHGEYSRCLIEIGKLKNLISKLPFFIKSSPYVWVIIALKGFQGQEDIYGPFFPLRGYVKLKEK